MIQASKNYKEVKIKKISKKSIQTLSHQIP